MEGEPTMTQGFQQQDRSVNFSFLKSAPSPQHGQKSGDKVAVTPPPPPRAFEPRPGH
jgi:hypothetical protein